LGEVRDRGKRSQTLKNRLLTGGLRNVRLLTKKLVHPNYKPFIVFTLNRSDRAIHERNFYFMHRAVSINGFGGFNGFSC